MDFIDEITVEVYGGKGGNGMASFRREKYVEYGGPSGGNGGIGGSVIFVGDEGKSTLYEFRYKRHIKSAAGENGKSKGMHGANAENTYIKVPLGTICFDATSGIKIGEILHQGQTLVVAEGGKGGRGNIALATHKNSAPNYAENGDLGVYRKLKIELKVLADVGVIGYPSVGKSTLISVVSNARPKIAEYPFTTLTPNLGMVHYKDQDFVIADMPGLIENAHQGVGLGIRFLRHIERCRVFIHMLDVTHEDPYQDFLNIQQELRLYDERLLDRSMLVVINKIDQVEDISKLEKIHQQLADYEVIDISAMMHENVDALLDRIIDLIQHANPIAEEINEPVVYRLEEEEIPFVIQQEAEGVFVITGPAVQKIFERTDFTRDEAVKRFARQLRGLGIDDKLRELGVKNQDTVRIFDYEFEFIDG